jgi:DNA polymerase (family 10)
LAKNTYTDLKGRKRWVRNDEIAVIVKQLGDYLIIGRYPEQHAKRYAQLAHSISRWPECVDELAKNDLLSSIPGVGGVITGYIDEIIRTGTTAKFDDDQYGTPPPRTVLELTAIERLGAKTARMLYQDYKIDCLSTLCASVKSGELSGVKGIGPKMLETIGTLCKNKQPKA